MRTGGCVTTFGRSMPSFSLCVWAPAGERASVEAYLKALHKACCGWVTSDVHTLTHTNTHTRSLDYTQGFVSHLQHKATILMELVWDVEQKESRSFCALVSYRHRQHEASVQQIVWMNNIHTKCLSGFEACRRSATPQHLKTSFTLFLLILLITNLGIE